MKYPMYVPGEVNADGNALVLTPPHPFIVENEQYFHPQGTVLDYGAGSGANSIYLAGKGHNVYAVDIESKYIDDSRKLLKQVGGVALENLSYVCGDLVNPMFKDGSFEVVLATIALQYIDKTKATSTLKGLQQLTKPGGINLFIAYIGTPEQQQIKSTYNLYEPGEIEQVYEDAGWDIITSTDDLRQLTYNYDDTMEDGSLRSRVSSTSKLVARRPDAKVDYNNNLIKQAEYYRRSDPELYEHFMNQVI